MIRGVFGGKTEYITIAAIRNSRDPLMLKLFPQPKQLRLHGPYRPFDPEAGIALVTDGGGDFARAPEVIADEITKTFPNALLHTGADPAAKWELRLALGYPRPEPEAYRLTVDGPRIAIIGSTWRGLLCGWATLRQLAAPENGERAPSLRDAEIDDWPDTRIRAASRWLVAFEAFGMAYDWGGGPADTFRRYREKIDFAMRHKINFAFFEGFTFRLDKYPGYADDLRKLNRYAADRNVSLEYGIHGIGIGFRQPASTRHGHGDPNLQGYIRGLGGFNRRNYPDGEIYPCMGLREGHTTRLHGSCRSNEALNREKQQELIRFVAAVHPRALYIHHEDIGIEEFASDWLLRCPDCRKRWPDDDVLSERGALGALAHGMNVLCDALASVRDPASGYDAARDCAIIFVPPGYGGGKIAPTLRRKIITLYTTLSKLLRRGDNIFLCCREMYCPLPDGSNCIAEVARALHANGHKLFLFAVNGADGFLNGALFSPGASLNGHYRGADAIFNFAGTIHQEPQELFNVECCWNLPPMKKIGFIRVERPRTRDDRPEWPRCFYETPVEFFRPGGWLRDCCHALYGRTTAKLMLRLLRLHEGEANDIRYPLVNHEYMMSKRPYWVADAVDALPEEQRAWLADHWQCVDRLTRRAVPIIRKMAHSPVPTARRETIDRLALSIGFLRRLASIMADRFARRATLRDLRRRVAACRRLAETRFGTNFLAADDDPESRLRYLARLSDALDADRQMKNGGK